MAWVWSDDLAKRILDERPDLADALGDWLTTPIGFSRPADETDAATVLRLLGVDVAGARVSALRDRTAGDTAAERHA